MTKRAFDLFISAITLILFLPILLIIATVLYFQMGGNVFFRQTRPGKNGYPFEMVKFKTMLDTVDESGVLLPDSERMTKFGTILRSTSLDELPEIWNVFKGDMSLVGPRPLLMEYLPLYSAEQFRRHDVKPGITGWAQVNGRNAIGWDEKFRLDVWYVENHGIWLDFKILLMTAKKVFLREGIAEDGEATMTKFSGNEK